MRKILIAPQRYVQGEGELARIGEYVLRHDRSALLVASAEDQERVQDRLDQATADGGFEFVRAGFNDEIIRAELERLGEVRDQAKCDVVVGPGGARHWMPRR